jgi:hypothetical protein
MKRSPEFHQQSRAIGTITLRLSPETAASGDAVTLNVRLSETAVGAVTIALSCPAAPLIALPPTVVVPEGSLTASVELAVAASALPQTVVITAIPPTPFSDPPQVSANLAIQSASVPKRTISGIMTLQGNPALNGKPLTVMLRHAATQQTTTRTVPLDSTGRFVVADIPAGMYYVFVKAEKWLSRVLTVDVTNGNVNNANATLLAGDVNADNAADIDDMTLLTSAFNKHINQPGYLPSADFNEDGVVDITDMMLLTANFNKTGETLQ